MGPDILIPGTQWSFHPNWRFKTFTQYSSVSWDTGSLVAVEKDCTGKAFTDNCFDKTTLFGPGYGFIFTLLTPDTLPAVGATMDIFRLFSQT
jgi:hypothetical protein